jgi:hypothetical protein
MEHDNVASGETTIKRVMTNEGYKTIWFLGGSPNCRNLLWIYWERLWLWK